MKVSANLRYVGPESIALMLLLDFSSGFRQDHARYFQMKDMLISLPQSYRPSPLLLQCSQERISRNKRALSFCLATSEAWLKACCERKLQKLGSILLNRCRSKQFIIEYRTNIQRRPLSDSASSRWLSAASADQFFMDSNAASHSGFLFHVAPMQCYTNRHLRRLLRMLSSRAVLWTEMEKVDDLLLSEAARDRRLRHDDCERPLVLQLGGGDPTSLAAAARLAIRFG
jgi:hypothetical protein